MKVIRKYNLGRFSEKYKYETLTIEVSGENIIQVIQQIDRDFRAYWDAIKRGEVL